MAKEEGKLGTLKHIYKVAFFSTLITSIVLIIAGLLLPPMGKIDPSVCIAVGEMFCWPTLAFGAKALEYRYEGKKD